MNRCFVFLSVLIYLLLSGFSQIRAQKSRPNIIFILTDDHRWDALGIAGNSIIQTPVMDDLAKNGTYFTNAFSTTPICAASRASILTGLHERTHGYTFQKPRLPKVYAGSIYPALLKRSGYHVGFYGKLGVTIESAGQYFDKSEFYDRSDSPNRGGYFYKTIHNDTVHLTEYTGYRAMEFIKNAPANQPFCLSLSFSAPHAQDNGSEQYYYQNKSAELYRNTRIPDPIMGDDIYFNSLPKEVRDGFNRVRWKWRFDTPEKYQMMVKGYYRMITEIDEEIGNIRKLLREKGLENNTVIIVMGDNGYFLGDRQLADKWLMYDVSIRIPLIVYDPRVKMPPVRKDMALNIDIASTILDLAGLNPPQNYQGKSLVPLIEKESASIKRDTVLLEHLWPIQEIPSSEGIRTERWKYFRYRFIDAPEELYDLSVDPMEKKNLAGNPAYSAVLTSCRTTLEKLASKYRKAKLVADDPFIKEKNF